MRHLGHASISRIDENNSWVKNSGIDSPCRLLPLVEAFIDAEEAQHTAQAVGHAMGVEGWTGGVVVDGSGHGDSVSSRECRWPTGHSGRMCDRSPP